MSLRALGLVLALLQQTFFQATTGPLPQRTATPDPTGYFDYYPYSQSNQCGGYSNGKGTGSYAKGKGGGGHSNLHYGTGPGFYYGTGGSNRGGSTRKGSTRSGSMRSGSMKQGGGCNQPGRPSSPRPKPSSHPGPVAPGGPPRAYPMRHP